MVLMVVVCLVELANAQERAADQTVTFLARDGAFSFSYPKDFQVCTRGRVKPCIRSYLPVCDEDALVCVVYPEEQFKGTSFGAASFQVRDVFGKENMTADVCVTPHPRKDGGTVSEWPEFLVSAERPIETIGGVQFLHGISGEAGLSHWLDADLYRGFHKQRCFELAVKQAGTDPHAFDPPRKTLSAAQQKRLDRTMSGILHSFRFLK